VSHQAPYHYFGDREAILAELAGEGFSRLGQSLVRTAAQAGSVAGDGATTSDPLDFTHGSDRRIA
jgi:AcrR family transcriptional regulator